MVSIDTSDLEKYIDRKCVELTSVMLEEGKNEMRNGISGHIDTGETINSIHSLQEGNKGMITVGGAAVWLEFGTGVLRNPSMHPKASELGMSKHGTYGQGKGANPNGWVYPTKDGSYRRTKGIAQTRFMFNAGQHLKKNIKKLGARVFK